MRSLKMIISLSLLIACQSVFAETYRCVGMDPHGKTVNVIYDENTGTINVNGQLLKVEAATNANNGVATEDYELDTGVKAYVSLVVEDKGKIIVRQMRSSDDEELSKAELACS